MCRLLAVVGKSKNTPLILRQFQKLAHFGNVPIGKPKGHKDGWGFVAYRQGRAALYAREPKDAFASEEYIKLSGRIVRLDPDVIVGHLRKSSVGNHTKSNTHPFLRKERAFAQNGTIFESQSIPLQKRFEKMAEGETDSERLFLHILQNMKKADPAGTRKAIMESVKYVRQNFDYTAVNLLLSDGRRLWALRDFDGKNELVRTKKLAQYYSLFIGLEKSSGAIVVSSEKMVIPDVSWKPMKNHELIEISSKTGKIRRVAL